MSDAGECFAYGTYTASICSELEGLGYVGSRPFMGRFSKWLTVQYAAV